VGDVLRLAPAKEYQAGSAFSLSSVALGSDIAFSTYFRFRISQSGGISDADGLGADGIVFVLQTVSNTAGGAGGGIGYMGLQPSIGVEFDTWNNGDWDNYNGNHIGINLHGSMDSFEHVVYPIRFNNSEIWHAWVDYSGQTQELEVRLGNNYTRPADPVLSYMVDLAQEIAPQAYVGFTAGTGSAYGDHDILSWEFRNTFSPIDPEQPPISVPDGASSLMLFGVALAGMRIVRRQ
jgi:hypothetical protein